MPPRVVVSYRFVASRSECTVDCQYARPSSSLASIRRRQPTQCLPAPAGPGDRQRHCPELLRGPDIFHRLPSPTNRHRGRNVLQLGITSISPPSRWSISTAPPTFKKALMAAPMRSTDHPSGDRRRLGPLSVRRSKNPQTRHSPMNSPSCRDSEPFRHTKVITKATRWFQDLLNVLCFDGLATIRPVWILGITMILG